MFEIGIEGCDNSELEMRNWIWESVNSSVILRQEKSQGGVEDHPSWLLLHHITYIITYIYSFIYL